MSILNKQELERYNRHLIIPEFGVKGQENLKNSKVLVIGTGGLGAPLLQYLAAAGIGTIGIVDFDKIEDSNLQRQVLFTTEDIGLYKVDVAKERISKQNPFINIITYNVKLTRENALDIISDYDIVADGTDNFPTRYLVNDACVKLAKVNVYASIFRFEGQLSVFNYKNSEGEYGPNFRDIFPTPPPPDLIPSCAEGGVLGVLTGIMGSLQANEVIKIASKVGEPLSGKLFVFDSASFMMRTLNLSKSSKNTIRTENADSIELIDYHLFCGSSPKELESSIKEISINDLQDKIFQGHDFQLIDVRDIHEYKEFNIGGLSIPKDSIEQHIDKIDTTKEVIIHCKTGKRSASVIRQLESNHGFTNLYNLKGGILAWQQK